MLAFGLTTERMILCWFSYSRRKDSALAAPSSSPPIGAGRAPIAWNERGLLPPGDHEVALHELEASLFVVGDGSRAAWQAGWRAQLVSNLRVLVLQLRSVGISEVYVDGSFCTNKDRPGDIDGYFVTDFGAWVGGQRAGLLALDSAWDLARVDSATGKPIMWTKHRVELYPVFRPPFERNSSRGIEPTETIDSFFRTSRDGSPRGLVRIVIPGAQT
jgi:hypothetical protein